MKHYLPFCLGTLVAIPLCISALVSRPAVLSPRISSIHDSLTAAEISSLEEGDILLRRGNSLASEVIVRSFSGSLKVSHCALVVRVSPRLSTILPDSRIGRRGGKQPIRPAQGSLAVIHSLNSRLSGVDGVQIEGLGDFLAESQEGSLVAVRPKLSERERESYLKAAEALLIAAVPFDNQYSLQTSDSVYCTELFYRTLGESGWGGKGCWRYREGILSFDSFLDRDWFSPVLNHQGSAREPVPNS